MSAASIARLCPNEKLVFTWAWKTTPERESLVTVLLKPDGDGTLLTLTHEQFFDEDARDRHKGGWNGALDKMEKICRLSDSARKRIPERQHNGVTHARITRHFLLERANHP